jgi:hypothetical protein
LQFERLMRGSWPYDENAQRDRGIRKQFRLVPRSSIGNPAGEYSTTIRAGCQSRARRLTSFSRIYRKKALIASTFSDRIGSSSISILQSHVRIQCSLCPAMMKQAFFIRGARLTSSE